jgi:hypothetical protein
MSTRLRVVVPTMDLCTSELTEIGPLRFAMPIYPGADGIADEQVPRGAAAVPLVHARLEPHAEEAEGVCASPPPRRGVLLGRRA